tara:strand:- start:10412 stop:13114 length:2703 start_codon:yes stop_codon:yes gene_type:complete
MSVQLIVYPQNNDGTYNVLSGSPTEFLVNGITFNGLNSTATYQSNGNYPPYQDVLDNAPASIPNTWYRFRVDGVVAYPLEASGNLVLDSIAGPATATGVYQRLTNLTIGATYNITINSTAPPSTGFISFIIADGNNIVSTGGSLATNTLIALGFVATSTDPTIMFAFSSTLAGTMNITSISIQPVIGAVSSGATNVLDNGQVILDLYEDEDLPLTLSVDNFKNVAEKVQSYSKAFKLPATKRNNRIFDQMFEITRSYDGVIFNPYQRTQCVLKQDGFILFEGFLRLLEVTDKEDEISYNVNLYSEVVALADFLKDKTIADINLDELEHPYNKTQIKYSWNDGTTGITYPNPNTSGFRDAYRTVKYPFIDWTHQYTLDGDGKPELPNLESSFRPFINVKYLVDRIFQDSPFTYTSEFFDADDFGNLYMDFNWGGTTMPVDSNTFSASWKYSGTPYPGDGSFKILPLIPETLAGGFPYSVVPPNYNTSTYIITATTDNEIYEISYRWVFETSLSSGSGVGQWVHTEAGGAVNIINNANFLISSLFGHYSGNLVIALNTGDTLQAQFYSAASTQLKQLSISRCTFVVSSATVTSSALLTSRGELKQWEFLKGFITMFNLVTLPDEDNPNNIKIEPYQDVFITPALTTPPLDWTDKIDVSEMKLTPLTDLKKDTIFKFVEDDDDYNVNQYKFATNGYMYGSQEYMTTNEFNILEGEEEITAEPFAATMVRPLMTQYFDLIIPTIYSMDDSGVCEPFDNAPRILYNNGVKDSGTSYDIPAQNGVVGSAAETDFLQFSHLSDVPTVVTTPPATSDTRDFHFGICQLVNGLGTPTANNLFNMYWLPYYSQLYNPNTRTMVIKVNLTPGDINTFKFNDTVYIKNRVFRVNKIDYKPNDLATVEFILIP